MANQNPNSPLGPSARTVRRPRHPAMHTCQFCGKSLTAHRVLPAALVGDNIAGFIVQRVPHWDNTGFICRDDLNRFRADYVRAEMQKDLGGLSALEEEVVRSLHDGELVADNLNLEFDKSLTLGERIADQVAEFGGNWRFIIAFFAFIVVWMIVNTVILLTQAFDPYPFILLNLALSLLAAVQAPIILMSQNRQEARDRMRAENDYKVNLKAELEVRAVSEKLDQLIHQQWAHLLEIQQIQIEMIEDMAGKAER